MLISFFLVARKFMASTNARFTGNAPWLPPVMSTRNGFCGMRCAMVRNSGRTGHPVTTAFAPQVRADISYPVAILVEMRASALLVNPGSALGSKITLGIPRIQVVSNIGPAAYPPTPKAAMGLCFLNTRAASSMAGASLKRFFSSVLPPFPFSPATRSVSSGSPACGTSFISIPRFVPTNTTSLSLPRDNHSRAIAIAGKTCPPVPPPAIRSFTPMSGNPTSQKTSSRASPSLLGGLLTYIQEHASCQQHHQQTRSPIAHERQRNPFGGHHSQHHREINQRLADDHGGDSQCQQSAKSIWRGERGAQPPPAVNHKQADHQHGADESQLLANHCVNKIGMRFRQIKQFLLALHQAHAAESARTHGYQGL